ncbi:MAG: hypothetical protein FWF81_07060 [Defluviitaleaceae bacterium]|nr:hypothetical protein [Defluviitaleaceae bacterium]
MKKRIFAIGTILTLVFVMLSFTGCGSEETNEDGTRRIGAILYGRDDAFGGQVYAILNYAAEALDVDIMWALNDFDAESQLAAAENLVAAGAEGIIFLPMNDNAVQLINNFSRANQVHYKIMFRDIGDADIRAQAQANPFYVGRCFEDNEQAAIELVKILAEEGRFNYGLGQITPGTPLAIRNHGFAEGARAVGGNILATYTAPADGTTHAYVAYIENFVNSFPDMDGLLMGNASGGAGETIINTLRRLTEPGHLRIAGFDTFDGMAEGFEEGWLSAIVSGMAPGALFSFVMLYNAVDETPLADGFTVLNQRLIAIRSIEDYALYRQYINNPNHMVYDADTIRSLTRRHNPDVTVQDVKNLMALYSLEWVMAQHR